MPLDLVSDPHFTKFSFIKVSNFVHMFVQESTVSTIWCEGQELRVNGTFNAYLLPRKPKLQRFRKSVNMTR